MEETKRGRNFVEKQKRRSEGTKIYRRLKKECGEILKVLNLQQVNPVGCTVPTSRENHLFRVHDVEKHRV